MKELLDRCRRALDFDPEIVVRAPGRANLVGEHTDYNDGFVLPAAIAPSTVVAGRRHADRVSLRSLNLPGDAEIDLDRPAEGASGWARYAAGIVRALMDEGVAVSGFEGVVETDLPIGSGLGSSGALEAALALALVVEPVAPVRLARICSRAENEYVGVRSGIMDPLVSIAAVAGHAMLIDCEDVSIEPVPMPTELAVLVLDSAVHRELGDSYNLRREECETAAAGLGVASLRHIDRTSLQKRAAMMDDVSARRARHVVSENDRVLATTTALRRGDLGALGRLFSESHASLRDDFEVSTPELDALVEIAAATEGVVASRLTGAGFGGCTVNLVLRDRAEAAAEEILRRYGDRTALPGSYWISAPAEGAELVT